MGAYRLISAAMSRIGKPISRLEDIVAYLNADPIDERDSVQRHAGAHFYSDRATPRDAPRPVYAGEPVETDGDELIFDSAPRLTVRMDFAPDEFGYLVNGEGLVLLGHADGAYDPRRGLRLKPIRLEDGATMPARATTAIRYKANLPRHPVSQPEHRDPGDMGASGMDVLAPHALAGGDIRIHDARGRPATLRLRWLKAQGADVGAGDGWRLLYRASGNGVMMGAAGRSWQAADAIFTFDRRGRLGEAVDVALDLGRSLEPVKMEFGRGGLTQFDDSTGLVKILACSQNGWARAGLREVAVRGDGRVLGRFDNRRVDLLGVAAFADPERRAPLREAA